MVGFALDKAQDKNIHLWIEIDQLLTSRFELSDINLVFLYQLPKSTTILPGSLSGSCDVPLACGQ